MFMVVVLLLIVAPLVELYFIIQVAHVVGGWNTIALLLAMGLIGGWLLKRQGLAILGKISAAVNAGRIPDKELVDGLLILVAGALMMAPGFIGDLLGLLLLVPPVRALVRLPLMKRFRAGKHGALFGANAGTGAGGGRFIGTFHVGGTRGPGVFDVRGQDATGRDTTPDQRTLDP